MLSPRIILIGHGKRTVCRYLQRYYGLTSSLAEVQYCKIVFPELEKLYDYKTEFDCFVDRDNHKLEWLNLIEKYNRSYPARIGNAIWKQSNIYSGIIDINEYKVLKARKMFDISLYIDASPRIASSGGITIYPEVADQIIRNDSSMERQLDLVMRSIAVKEIPGQIW